MSCFRCSKSSRRGDELPTVRRNRRGSSSTISSIASDPTPSLPTPRRIISVADLGRGNNDIWHQRRLEARGRREGLNRGLTTCSSTASTSSRPSEQASPNHLLARVRGGPLPFERGGSLPDDPRHQHRRQAASNSIQPTTGGLQESQTPPRHSGFHLPDISGPPSDQDLVNRLPSSPRAHPGDLTVDVAAGAQKSVLTRELADGFTTSASSGTTHTDSPGIQQRLTEVGDHLPPRQASNRTESPFEPHDMTSSHQPPSRTAPSERSFPAMTEGPDIDKLSVRVPTTPRQDSATRTPIKGASSAATESSPRSQQRPPRPTEATPGRMIPVPSRPREAEGLAARASVQSRQIASENVARSSVMSAARALQGLQFASSSRESSLSRFSPSREKIGRTVSDSSSRLSASPSSVSQSSHFRKAESPKHSRVAQPAAHTSQSPRGAPQSKQQVQLSRAGSSTNSVAGQASGSADLDLGERSIRIRVEAEILIADKKEAARAKVDRFVADFAERFNKELGLQASSMRAVLRNSDFAGDSDRWYWKKAIVDRGEYSPFQIRLCSPMIEPASNPNWRQEIEAAWSFLNKWFKLRGSSTSHSSIYFSLSSLQTGEVKKIAQAALWFNSALEIIVPNITLDPNMKTIYLDNPSTPTAQKTTSIGVDMLGAVHDNASRTEVVKKMQAGPNYNWNFADEIEYRRPPASKTSKEILSWVELTMAFCLSALQVESTADLKNSDGTVQGLRAFLQRADVKGVTQLERMDRLWAR